VFERPVEDGVAQDTGADSHAEKEQPLLGWIAHQRRALGQDEHQQHCPTGRIDDDDVRDQGDALAERPPCEDVDSHHQCRADGQRVPEQGMGASETSRQELTSGHDDHPADGNENPRGPVTVEPFVEDGPRTDRDEGGLDLHQGDRRRHAGPLDAHEPRGEMDGQRDARDSGREGVTTAQGLEVRAVACDRHRDQERDGKEDAIERLDGGGGPAPADQDRARADRGDGDGDGPPRPEPCRQSASQRLASHRAGLRNPALSSSGVAKRLFRRTGKANNRHTTRISGISQYGGGRSTVSACVVWRRSFEKAFITSLQSSGQYSMDRRQVLALVSGLVVPGAGCLGTDRSGGISSERARSRTTRSPMETPSSATPTSPPSERQTPVQDPHTPTNTPCETLSGVVHTAFRYVVNVDGIAVYPPSNAQFVFVTPPDIEANPPPEDFRLDLGGERFSPTVSMPGDRDYRSLTPGITSPYTTDDRSGSLVFDLPTIETETCTLRYDGTNYPVCERVLPKLAAAPDFRLTSVAVPDAVDPGEPITLTVTVTNEGARKGTFLAGVRYSGLPRSIEITAAPGQRGATSVVYENYVNAGESMVFAFSYPGGHEQYEVQVKDDS